MDGGVAERAGLMPLRLVMEGRCSSHGHSRRKSVALQTKSVHPRTFEHAGVDRAMRRVAGRTAFSLDRRVFKDERSGLRLVAAAANLLLRDCSPQFPVEETPVLIVTIGAAQQFLFHSMMERPAKLAPRFGMTCLAQLGLGRPQQELLFDFVMYRMAAQATDLGHAVHRPLKIPMLFGVRVAREASFGDLGGSRACEADQGARVTAGIHMLLRWTMARLATLKCRTATLVETRLPMA